MGKHDGLPKIYFNIAPNTSIKRKIDTVSDKNISLNKNYENILTEAQPQPDFLPGLTSFLQFIAHADGELKT